jgi:Domain of unknown function (DUF2017)
VSGTGPEDSADFPHLGEPDDPVSAADTDGAVAGFRGTRRGVTGWFAPPQAGIIRALVSQVAELLGGAEESTTGADSLERSWDTPGEFAAVLGLSEATVLPDDPVLARLLPDAYTGDAEAAGDFRRYTERDLRSGKVAAACTVLATLPEGGGRVELSTDDAQAWLRALNDVRLALGVRLSITEDFEERMAQLDPDDPRSAYFWVYDWLSYLQGTLVRALS